MPFHLLQCSTVVHSKYTCVFACACVQIFSDPSQWSVQTVENSKLVDQQFLYSSSCQAFWSTFQYAPKCAISSQGIKAIFAMDGQCSGRLLFNHKVAIKQQMCKMGCNNMKH